MLYLVVSYDITEDRRRNRVAKLMENYGKRVQYSVFECLLQEYSLLQLQEQLQAILDFETDSVRFYRLCVRCRNAIEILGRGTTQHEEPFVIL
jgi:CRISPR-associated protein Cas2